MSIDQRLSAVVAVFALSVTVTAQTGVDQDARVGLRATAAEQLASSGVISGTVISDSGAPIARARVTLSAAAVRTAVTDEQGAFRFASLPPDEYALSVSKIGFLDVAYGERQPGSGRPGTPIHLEPGQRIDVLSLRMPRGGVITGTVLDESGEPAIAVPVRAYRWRIRGGEPTFAATSFDHTDDRGIYRIPFLAPGDYIIAATPRPETSSTGR